MISALLDYQLMVLGQTHNLKNNTTISRGVGDQGCGYNCVYFNLIIFKKQQQQLKPTKMPAIRGR